MISTISIVRQRVKVGRLWQLLKGSLRLLTAFGMRGLTGAGGASDHAGAWPGAAASIHMIFAG